MAKIVEKAYLVIFASLAVFIAFSFFAYRTEVHDAGTRKLGFVRFQNLPNERVPSDTVSGYRTLGQVHLNEISGENCHLIFQSLHQSVAVFYGDKCIYSMNASSRNSFTKTTGCVWNDVLLTEELSDEDITIELTPAYRGIHYDFPDVYLGAKSSIIWDVFVREMFPVGISIVLMIFGFFLMGYVIYNRNNSEVDRNLLWLGFFAFLLGLWKACDSPLSKIIFHGLPVFSLLPFVALLLMIMPFVCFFREMHSSKDDKLWMVPCVISTVAVYLCMFLQYFNILDLRQLFPFILLTMLIGILILSYLVYQEYKRVGWNVKLKRNLIGMLVVIVGFIVDVGVYFFSGGTDSSGLVIFGMLVYVIAQSATVLRESGTLITSNESVQEVEDLAYHDKLTGLFNRAAFITDTDPYAVTPDNYAVVVLDLNDLKKCNDNLGHEKGDKYIADSAHIIQDTFGTIGKCYRMGGDEFYILVPQGGKTACREQQAAMESKIAAYNEGSPDIKISIACGYARYDNRMDYDLNATAKRADKLMYQHKEEMKGHVAPR